MKGRENGEGEEGKGSSRLCLQLLSLDSLPDAIPHGDLHKVLHEVVDVLSDASGQLLLHPVHEKGHPLDHPDHLHQGILLLTGVVVPSSLSVCVCVCVCVRTCVCGIGV